MPAYEYKCLECGYSFEKFQGIKDKPVAKCPNCDGKGKRLISGGAGVIFKGSGFYATDYARTEIPRLVAATDPVAAGRHLVITNPVNLNAGILQK